MALAAIFAAAAAPAASIRFEEFGPFQVRSTTNGQLSSNVQELRVNTLAELQVKYEAPAGHCASLRMHFLLDGVERATSAPIAPGKSSDYIDFGVVAAGEHVVGLRAEGLLGGCDVGQLASWGGFAVVRTTVDNNTGLEARAANFGPVIFYSTLVNYAMGHLREGIYVAADGDVYSFQYDPVQRDWNPAPDVKGRITVFDLQERFSHHPRWLLKLDAQELQQRVAALALSRYVPNPTATPYPLYDQTSFVRGAYRLDTESGAYVNVPICALGGRLEEPPSSDPGGLCKWLDSLLRRAY